MALKMYALGKGEIPEQGPERSWEADVVIVGGAVGGASMAHALAERGLSSILLERNDEFPEINRGDAIMPLTLSFFDRWGAIPYMMEMGAFALYEWKFISPRLGDLGTWSFEDLPFKFNHQLILRHTNIHRALYAAMATKTALINAQRHATVTGAIMDEERQAVVGVVGTQGGVPFEARGKVVVAADGPQSKLRSFVGIEQEERYVYEHEYLMLTTPRPKVPELDRRGIRYISGFGLTVVIPLDGGEEVRIPVQIPGGTLPEWRALSEKALRHRLIIRAPLLELVDTSSAMDKLAHSYHVHWRNSYEYVKNNVCFIGEAAHTVHPGTAQGMNMAALDAEVLAAVIRRCVDRDGISDETLKRYEQGRMETNLRVMDTSHHQTHYHTSTGLWHEIWGVRNYRWTEDENAKREISINISGLRNPTSKELGILDYLPEEEMT